MTTSGVNGRRQPALAIGKRPWSPQAPSLFSTPDADSIAMAVQAAGTAEDPATIAGSLWLSSMSCRTRWRTRALAVHGVPSGVTWFVTRNGVNPWGFRHTRWAAV